MMMLKTHRTAVRMSGRPADDVVRVVVVVVVLR